jgi:hypothetical protein
MTTKPVVDADQAPVDLDPLREELRIIYNKYRSALLNLKYYGCKVDRISFRNKIFEAIIAIGASSSGVAGFALWKSDQGKYIWAAISGASILLSVIKPIVGYSSDIEEYSKLYGEFATISADYENLVNNLHKMKNGIAKSGQLPQDLIPTVRKLEEKLVALAPRGDRTPEAKLVKLMTDAVNKQIPASSLWIP